MKKILFSAIAVLGFAVANAQSTDNSDAAINVTIVKTVEIVPLYNPALEVTFDQPAQFGTWQSMNGLGARSWGIRSTDPGTYTVSFDRGNIPASVGLRYTLSDWGNASVATNKDISEPSTSNFYGGPGVGVGGVVDGGFEIYLGMDAKVNWGTAAGAYSGTVTITATIP